MRAFNTGGLQSMSGKTVFRITKNRFKEQGLKEIHESIKNKATLLYGDSNRG